MSFRESRLLSSKPARISLIALASFLTATVLAFHLESFLFQQRVHSILSRVAQIQLGNTSEQEFRLLPELELDPTSSVICSTEQGASTEYGLLISDFDGGPLSKFVRSLDHNRATLQLLYLLGHRFHRFVVSSSVCRGKVVRLKYSVWIDDDQRHDIFQGIEVSASGFSRDGWVEPMEADYRYEEVTPYRERVARNAPEHVLEIIYVADAPADFLHSAFDLRLACLHSFTGCANTRQLLPNIWPPRFPWRRDRP